MSYVHINGWVEVTEPNGPTGPVDPGWGGGPPVYPGHGLPGGGHIDNSLPWAPVRPGNKPPGAPIVPAHPGNRPPNGGRPPHAGWPGDWVPVDPGWGKPPLWGFVPVDPGFGIDEDGPPPVIGGGPATPPGRPPVVGGGPATPPVHIGGGPITGPGGGHWVPIDPDFGRPGCPGGGKPHPPIWAFIPNPPDLSKPVEPEEPPTTATPK